jgi:hypothetical protein
MALPSYGMGSSKLGEVSWCVKLSAAPTIAPRTDIEPQKPRSEAALLRLHVGHNVKPNPSQAQSDLPLAT